MNSVGVPPPIKIADGVSRFSVPLPTRNPWYLLVYLIEGSDGLYAIDAGWHDPPAYESFVAGLSAFGYGLSDVRGILITHFHPDHFGLAARLREESGAWIGVHPADADLAAMNRDEAELLSNEHTAMLRRAGAPEPMGEHMGRGASSAPWRSWLVEPDVLLRHGATDLVPGRQLEVIWTPGHTPGHVCFADQALDVLFTGDHILPDMIPILPFGQPGMDNSLTDFVHSLDLIEQRGHSTAHPGHEREVDDLPSRIESLRSRYRARLAEVADAIDDQTLTAWQIAGSLSWPRPWDAMRDTKKRIVLGETMAYLTYLASEGRIVEHPGEPSTFQRLA